MFDSITRGQRPATGHVEGTPSDNLAVLPRHRPALVAFAAMLDAADRRDWRAHLRADREPRRLGWSICPTAPKVGKGVRA